MAVAGRETRRLKVTFLSVPLNIAIYCCGAVESRPWLEIAAIFAISHPPSTYVETNRLHYVSGQRSDFASKLEGKTAEYLCYIHLLYASLRRK